MNWGLSLSTSMRQMSMSPTVPATNVTVKMSSSQSLTSDSYSSSLSFTINTSSWIRPLEVKWLKSSAYYRRAKNFSLLDPDVPLITLLIVRFDPDRTHSRRQVVGQSKCYLWQVRYGRQLHIFCSKIKLWPLLARRLTLTTEATSSRKCEYWMWLKLILPE